MLQFRKVTTEEEMQKLYQLRYDVYCLERGYLSPEDYADQLEHDELDDYSAHYLAEDPALGVVGCSRLICSNPYGFPCEEYFDLTRRSPDKAATIEISRLIVAPGARKTWRYIFMGLVKEFFLFSVENRIRHCYAVLERPLLHQLKRLGFMFEPIGEGKWHCGGVTYPVYMDFTRYAESVWNPRNDNWYYQYLRAPRNDRQALAALMDRASLLTGTAGA